MYRWIASPASAKIVAVELMRADQRPPEAAPEQRPAEHPVTDVEPVTAPVPGRRRWFAWAFRVAQ